MCGIYGEISLRGGASPVRETVARMGAAIVHRGPDDDGLHCDGRVAIGLRRLSIIDLSGGHQPLFNEDGRLALVCNGEIYNYRELRARLQAAGHRFSTGSDAETLLHAYEEYGDGFLQQVQGMFGFALWDGHRQRLLLGRDRLGIKPVYYARTPGGLAFASEAKALLARGDLARALDPLALEHFLTLGYVSQPHSLFAGIAMLPPGSLLVVEGEVISQHSYWSLNLAPETGRPESQWLDEIRETLGASIQAQMVSDVPIAAFLSGGIDSSLIVAFMSRFSDAPVNTYSIGYTGSSGAALYNELDHARLIAERHATRHHEIVVQPDVVPMLPGLVFSMDAPISDSALITSNLVSEFASRDVKVILSGVGGDELFGGYDRYLMAHYVSLVNRMPAWLRRGLLTPVARRLPVDRHSRLLNILRYVRTVLLLADAPRTERYHQLMEVFSAGDLRALLRTGPAGEADALQRVLARTGQGSELDSFFMADMHTQLTDDLLLLTDKMSMAHSLECRVPLLDERLVELAARMPADLRVRGRQTRYAIRKALRGILPDATLDRKKRGFGAPVGAWLKRELEPVIGHLLSREQVERRGLFNPRHVAALVADHRANRADHTDHLFALITLELWQRIFLDGLAPSDLAGELAGLVRRT